MIDETVTNISQFDPTLAPHVTTFGCHEIDGNIKFITLHHGLLTLWIWQVATKPFFPGFNQK